jgi:hypothetical protein
VSSELYQDLVTLIRFPLMSMADVGSVVAPSNLLTKAQLLEVFTFVASDERSNKISFSGMPSLHLLSVKSALTKLRIR